MPSEHPWVTAEATVSSATTNYLPGVGTSWTGYLRARIMTLQMMLTTSYDIQPLTLHDNGTLHGHLNVHQLSLSYFTEFIYLVWYTFCNRKRFAFIYSSGHGNKVIPYCLILSFKDNQEKSSLLPLGSLITCLFSKNMGLAETATIYVFQFIVGYY